MARLESLRLIESKALDTTWFKLLFRSLELGVLPDEEASGCLGSVFTFTK